MGKSVGVGSSFGTPQGLIGYGLQLTSAPLSTSRSPGIYDPPLRIAKIWAVITQSKTIGHYYHVLRSNCFHFPLEGSNSFRLNMILQFSNSRIVQMRLISIFLLFFDLKQVTEEEMMWLYELFGIVD
ncbi:MAG: hypothetical protein EZS28_015284 [Streblomastix strix]|uniref:Uncharacterized protein n=1 Tax=Streblomastix strix TaxID=222440 RepID=A0A5J4W2P6_9EUKA|nr:MAG: hypothetical protein EZS28_015284 [Streblomastix strix]